MLSYLETQWEREKNGGAQIDEGEKPLKTLGLPDVPACGLLVPKECSLEATGLREAQDLHSSLSSALGNCALVNSTAVGSCNQDSFNLVLSEIAPSEPCPSLTLRVRARMITCVFFSSYIFELIQKIIKRVYYFCS